MTDTVTVDIPLDLAKNFAHVGRGGDHWPAVQEVVRAALPPEYPDGTIAWVTSGLTGVPWLCVRDGGAWRRAWGESVVITDFRVVKVEVIPVAGEGEMVVPRPERSAGTLRSSADVLEENYQFRTAEFLREVADRL